MGRVLLAIAGTCAALLASSGAIAAPVIEVRARTAVELDAVRRTPSGLVVRGRVVDANSAEPVAARVEVAVGDFRAVTESGNDGTFEVPLSVRRERVDIEVRASGPQLGESRSQISGLEVSKRPLDLSLSIGPVTTRELTAVIRASSEGRPAAGIEATVGALEKLDVEGSSAVPLGRVITGADGRAELRLRREGPLASPGRLAFRASFPGDDLYDPATAEATHLLVVDTELEFQIDGSEVSYEDDIEGAGILTDSAGRPVRAAVIDLLAGTGDVIDSAVTDDDGRFELEVEASELGAGPASLQAVFDSPQPWFESSRSRPLSVTIAEPAPIPVGYTLGAFGATALALLAFVGLRTRPWLRFQRSPRAQESTVEDAAIPPRPVVGGLREARPGIISTIRGASDHGFSAVLVDAVTGVPISRARIILELGESTREASADDAGEVRVDELAEGVWRGVARAAFYVSESFSVTIPHRGELRGARIEMVPVRERIFDIYRDAALPWLPRPDLWGIWTPRQIIDRVRRQSPAPALAALTDFVEESYFSQRTPTEEVLPRADELSGAAREEARGAGADGGGGEVGPGRK